jgi:hypothetical protein
MWLVSKGGATLRYPHPGGPDERRRRFEEVYTANCGTGLDGTAHFHLGQILGWEALLDSGIVQHPGQLP